MVDILEMDMPSVLIIADSGFRNLCDDSNAYITRLKDVLSRRRDDYCLLTVSGKYGLSAVDPSLGVVFIDDKNKTLFVQTMENSISQFDELIIISISPTDPFLNGAREVMINHGKSVTVYGYNRARS